MTMNLDDFDSFLPSEAVSSALSNLQSQHDPSDGSGRVDDNNNFLSGEFNVDGSRHSSGSENEMSSLSTPAASDGDRCTSPENSESSDDDDEFDIAFLSEKRLILKRYCDVINSRDRYYASVAKTPEETPPHSIWDEAKEMMEEIFDVKDCQKAIIAPTIKPEASSPKRPKIDTSNVTRIDSSAYNSSTDNIFARTIPFDHHAVKAPALFDSDCIVNALKRLSSINQPATVISDVDPCEEVSISSLSSTVENQPLLYNLPFPSRKRKGRCKGTTMEQAMSLTDVAQLICEANEPFVVMHANKAFFTYSDLSPADVIGKSILDIIQIDNVEGIISESMQDQANPDFASGTLGNKSCQVQIKPVTSHSMSHVLVQIYSHDAAIFAKAAISASKHGNVLVGCVG